MALNPEWRKRVELWRDCMVTLFYRKLADIPTAVHRTMDQLTPAQAEAGPFEAVVVGRRWGSQWEYGWFRGAFTVPEAAAGQRLVLRLDVAAEAAVLVDGEYASARSHFHTVIPIESSAVAGTEHSFLAEAYAGHGPTPCGGGPMPPEQPATPPCPEAQQQIGDISIGTWDEDMYQLWLDVQTLLEIRDNNDADSLRVQEIDVALREMTAIVDLELPFAERRQTVRAGRHHLAPLLDCRNGTTAPTMYCFGHSHIDVAWLWPLRETEAKCWRTFSTMLKLMSEYPEFTFLQSQPHLYWMTKQRHPKLYAEIKQAVERGQWIPEGGMWVEADTNVTGGESLIRQFIHGKRFFMDEFGVDSQFMWLPDVFGYSAALPQIMADCGIKYFSTAKIFWNYGGGQPFPYNSFWWEGLDGTRVFAHIHNDYNAHTSPASTIRRWRERRQKEGKLSARLYPFGWGDGGGGPTRDHLEFLRRQHDIQGAPKTRLCHPLDYFRDEEQKGLEWLPTYVGELYFQCHRGTYTSQARTKRGNRRCEFGLREAELWSTVAATVGGWSYPREHLAELWRGVLLNQFHDIIPGSSIRRVYEEAEALYDRVLAEAEECAAGAAAALLAPTPDTVTLFNSLSWERAAVVALPAGMQGAADASGSPLPVQVAEGTAYVSVRGIPACGCTTLRTAAPATGSATVTASSNGLENEHLKLTIDGTGEITSIVDKANGRQLAAGPCNSLRLYRDVPNQFDAWDIDSPYRDCPVDITGPAEVIAVTAGPLFGMLRVRRAFGDTQITQNIVLAAGSRRVEFRTTILWHERHKLLKVNFPVNLRSDEALHEIQFGHLARPTHASMQFDADRFEVCNQKWTAISENTRGVAILNDCKYGVDVDGNSINLTLLKSALAPDSEADQGEQTFTYAFYPWNGAFADCAIVREAYELNVPVMLRPGASDTASYFAVDAPSVIIEAVKTAEDGSGDIVLRLYESKRTTVDCTLQVALPVSAALRTNMLEEGDEVLPCTDGAIPLTFRPFEIKTVRLRV